MFAIANRLQLSGIVCKVPLHKTSPAGIAHCQFLLEHRSQQQEAGFAREAWCRIPVVISGKILPLTHKITAGSRVFVQGFISSHRSRNGLSKLVLHAEQIELIDSGD